MWIRVARLEVRARLRRLRCPEHGVLVEGVPFARDGARFTGDFEDGRVACDQDRPRPRSAGCCGSTGRRSGGSSSASATSCCQDRLKDLFKISLDEVAWRKGHRYLTLSAITTRAAWCGARGKGQAAADRFFDALDPPLTTRRRTPAGCRGSLSRRHGPVRPMPDRPGRPRHPGRVASRRQELDRVCSRAPRGSGRSRWT